ncbi:arsenical resistance protein ArsH [Cognatiyoonia sediminum]|uniref:Arsenical resistance protein ArsH n=1 Tax=Cognatiyoonia sediminum TaxID=1508389 RepID=A0A1M5SFY7_9RHOB|nr:arsenical resistance protein ArsH [Cognatiyoonia sediminum]SHH37401.1 arsenical resistance protein ArsH [Cognatiyoonia sediminum]
MKQPNSLIDTSDLPNIVEGQLKPINGTILAPDNDPGHPPRILLLYGSLREQSYSRIAAEEGARVLRALGCETKFFNPSGLPLPGDADETQPKVQELRDLVMWSEGMVWCSPERHGTMTAVMKAQIDWIPLAPIGGIRPTQGKTLAIMQVCGGSQSFNTVNELRILGRWMRLLTIPNQSSVPKAWLEFENGRMKAGPLYNRIVDVMEELARFTWLTRARKDELVDRYSERVESAEDVRKRVGQN